MARALAPVGLEIVPAPPEISPPDAEDGRTLEAIAIAKAASWSGAIGGNGLVVASDGGLLIPGMGPEWDPTRTRRFAGDGADARSRADALLRRTAGLRGRERRIGWREALAFAVGGRAIGTFAAQGPWGLLAEDYDPEDLDEHGFWIPALWICPELGGKRLARLTGAEREGRKDHWRRLARHAGAWMGR